MYYTSFTKKNRKEIESKAIDKTPGIGLGIKKLTTITD